MTLLCLVFAGVIPTTINAATPSSVRDRSLVAPATGAVMVGRNAGQLIAPLAVAPIVQAGLSWNYVGVAIVIATLIGMLAASRVEMDDHEPDKASAQ